MADVSLNPPIFTTTSFIFIDSASDLNDNRIWFHLNNANPAVRTSTVQHQVWKQNEEIPNEAEVPITAEGELYYINIDNIINNNSLSYDTFYNFRISAFVASDQDNTRKWSDIISIMRASVESLSWELPVDNYVLPFTEKLNVKVNLNTSSQDQIARFKVEVTLNSNVVYSSGAIINNNTQYAQLIVPYNFVPYAFSPTPMTKTYTINVICITNYGYVLTGSKNFSVTELSYSDNIQLNITSIPELGVNRLVLHDTIDMYSQLLLKFYRTKAKENDWILIKEDYWYATSDSDYIWDDRTIVSDEEYQYMCIYADNMQTCIIDAEDLENPIIAVTDPISFEYDYLTDPTAQLTIQYNKDLSGYRYNTNDAITATIGSQYPFVRRAAAAKYRTFTVGGMITFNTEAFYADTQMEDSIIHNDFEHMHEFVKLFHSGNDDIGSTTIVFNKDSEFVQGLLENKKEAYLERLFRNAVEEFLYSNTVKLFRSATEGNIFVKLTNVQLTPEKQLGRMIYSFSATATEVGAFNEANLKEFDFIDQVGETIPIHITDYAIEAESVTDGTATGVTNEISLNGGATTYKVVLKPFARLIFF